MFRHLLFKQALLFLAADTGTPSGGTPSTTAAAEKPKTLSAALEQLSTLETNLANESGARKKADEDLKTAQDQNQKLQGQFDQATKAAEKSNADLVTANNNLTTVTGERDAAQKDLEASNKNVSRLEQLCGVKGLDKNQAAPAASNTADGAAIHAKWESLKGAAKTEFFRANKSALKAFSAAEEQK